MCARPKPLILAVGCLGLLYGAILARESLDLAVPSAASRESIEGRTGGGGPAPPLVPRPAGPAGSALGRWWVRADRQSPKSSGSEGWGREATTVRTPRASRESPLAADPVLSRRERALDASEWSWRSWPYFAHVEALAGSVSTRLAGIDPAAPRPLELWRIGGVPVRVATTVSDPAGRFDFGQQLLPSKGVRLQVVPASAAVALAREATEASRITLRYAEPD